MTTEIGEKESEDIEKKLITVSLRWYNPDQVLRVSSQPKHLAPRAIAQHYAGYYNLVNQNLQLPAIPAKYYSLTFRKLSPQSAQRTQRKNRK